jgi:hypothetical protein
LFGNKLNAYKTVTNNINLVNFSDGEINTENDVKSTEELGKESVLNQTSVFDEKKSLQKNSLFKTAFPLIGKPKEGALTRSTLNYDNVNKFFCPYCEHCNNMRDKHLENHMHSLSQANVIINKGFDYIVQNLKFFDKSAIDLFSFTERTIDEMIKDDKMVPMEKITSDINEDVIEVLIF